MDTKLPLYLAESYTSNSQIIRVITEHWVHNSIFCPNCGNSLNNFDNNKPVADFFCINCSEEYELKSKNGNLGKKIVDGAYSTMIERLNSQNNPNFFFLTYNKSTLDINNFITIPRHFFTPKIIEKRKPLSPLAKRAGWTGCNIILHEIPEMGKVFYIKDSIIQEKDVVLQNWEKTTFIKNYHDLDFKGWILDVLQCIDSINKTEFFLDDVYMYENLLKYKHPLNNNIKAKIRQQLQLLRDENIIDFIGRGRYRLK